MRTEARNKLTRACHLFRLTRPYSWVCAMARGLLVACAAGSADNASALVNIAWITLLLWFSLNWISERVQKNPGRQVPSLSLIGVTLSSVFVATIVHAPVATPFLVVYLILVRLYPEKARRSGWGSYGPLLRGGTVAMEGLFVIAFVSGLQGFSMATMSVVAVLTLLHIARNLLGDLRDIRTDRHEMPNRFGVPFSCIVILASISVATIFALFSAELQLPMVALSLFHGVIFVALWVRFRTHSSELLGYTGHRFFVFFISIGEAWISVFAGLPIWVAFFLTAAALALNATYRHTPGKEYPPLWEALRFARVQ